MDYERYRDFWIRHGAWGDQDKDVIREVWEHDGYRLAIRPCGQFVFDIGAHIGTFAHAWKKKCPDAQIVCVEACPENIEILTANVGDFATVIQAACTYVDNEIVLLNSVKERGTATGGSTVVGPETSGTYGHLYWKDTRPLPKVTLEDLMRRNEFPRIDVLKLDCEGSEFSILENCACLDRIRFICGEYHNRNRWEALLKSRFADWGYAHLHTSGELGMFHLQHPQWSKDSP